MVARCDGFAGTLRSGHRNIRIRNCGKTPLKNLAEGRGIGYGEILIDHIKGTKYLSVDVPFAGAGKAISLLKHLNLLDGSSGALDFVAGQKGRRKV